MDNRIKLVIAGVIIAVVAIVYVVIKQQEKLTEANSVPVYFVKTVVGSEYQVLPVRRKVDKNDDRFVVALTELIKGPTKREKKLGYFSEIPADTSIIEITSKDDVKIINLSHDFETGGGSATMEMRLEQLINTSLDSAGGVPVYLQIEGKQVSTLGGEGIPVPQPLSNIQTKGAEGPCK
ncbi:MAG: GerMN domain-containing protein [Candidatus Gastranaerophilales bacterium]|nr:GerMN domain-containing protein [Candidatus Gastranaerophilales bacterium]